jgi:hypothetical protein
LRPRELLSLDSIWSILSYIFEKEYYFKNKHILIRAYSMHYCRFNSLRTDYNLIIIIFGQLFYYCILFPSSLDLVTFSNTTKALWVLYLFNRSW